MTVAGIDMSYTRRDFIKGSAWMGMTAVAAGCMGPRLGFGTGGAMQGFALPPMKRVRVAVIGLGLRGTPAVHRIAMLPGVEIVAICDKKDVRIEENLAWFRKRGQKLPMTFNGVEGWKAVCDWDDVDVVYIVTPWDLHAPIALRAMRNGKVALVEVPGARTVDECWELVETSEKTRIPCMMLENACYGEIELLGYNLARFGLLGEIVHSECAYIHDLRMICCSKEFGESEWRHNEQLRHKGNLYPTHGLGPVCMCMNINRGDRFDYLVSLESNQVNFERYIREVMPADDPRRKDRIEMGDMNTTLIKTALGKSIMVQHDVSSPRPYSRLNLMSGTKGIFWGMPWRPHGISLSTLKIGFEERCGEGIHNFLSDEKTNEIREQHKHSLWKKVGEIAKKVGGHGGQDFIMDLRWAYCLQNGIPLDIDVYDLAAMSCLCELTEKSVRNKSRPYDIPDFTRGGWKTAKPLGSLDIDVSSLDFSNVGKDESAITV